MILGAVDDEQAVAEDDLAGDRNALRPQRHRADGREAVGDAIAVAVDLELDGHRRLRVPGRRPRARAIGAAANLSRVARRSPTETCVATAAANVVRFGS